MTTPSSIDALRPADAARCAELERLLFPGDDPWTERAFRDELRAGHHYLAARSVDRADARRRPRGRLVGYAGLAFVAGPPQAEAEIHTIGVDPALPAPRHRPGAAARPARGGRRGGGHRLPRGAHRQRRRPRALRGRRLHRGRHPQALLPAQRRRRLHHATGTTMIVLGIETSCDETGVGHRAHRRRRRARPCWPTRSPPRWTSTPASAAWSPRSRPGRTCRPWSRRCTGRWHRRGAAGRRGRGRGHRRARADRRAAGRGGRGQGLRGGLGRAAVRGEPPVRARRGGHPAARPAAAVPGPAGLRRALQPARRARPGRPGHPARRHHRRRRGRGVRQGGPAARAAVPRRPAHRPGGPRRRPGGDRLPARADRTPRRAVRLLLLRAEDRGGPARRGAAAGRRPRCRSRTWRPASRRPWSTCSPPRRCARPASGAWTRCCSAAGSRPTPGCGRWPRSAATRPGSRCGCPGPACAPTTARWSPRWARTCWPAARPRPRWTCPPTRPSRSRLV